jgi:putative transcriptional regulator
VIFEKLIHWMGKAIHWITKTDPMDHFAHPVDHLFRKGDFVTRYVAVPFDGPLDAPLDAIRPKAVRRRADRPRADRPKPVGPNPVRPKTTRLNAAQRRQLSAALVRIDFATGRVRVNSPPLVDVAELRKRLHMTQERFCFRFGFPVATLRHWERGDRMPRGPAKALLYVIWREPTAVLRALDFRKQY